MVVKQLVRFLYCTLLMVSSACAQQLPPKANTNNVDVPITPASKLQAPAALAQTDSTITPVVEKSPEPEKLIPDPPPKTLSIPKIGASESPRNDEIHDNINNAIDTLQDPTKAMADFPRDRRLQVDWVAALQQGLIEPRAELNSKGEMTTLDLDIIMKNTKNMPWVKFPHSAHTQWLDCSNCHPKIFLPKEHSNPISMNKVLRGEFCGVCHDKVAFSLFICERCHSVPHKGSGPKWW